MLRLDVELGEDIHDRLIVGYSHYKPFKMEGSCKDSSSSTRLSGNMKLDNHLGDMEVTTSLDTKQRPLVIDDQIRPTKNRASIEITCSSHQDLSPAIPLLLYPPQKV